MVSAISKVGYVVGIGLDAGNQFVVVDAEVNCSRRLAFRRIVHALRRSRILRERGGRSLPSPRDVDSCVLSFLSSAVVRTAGGRCQRRGDVEGDGRGYVALWRR